MLAGRVNITIIGANDSSPLQFESTGRIIFEASDGETLEVMIANADMSEPYAMDSNQLRRSYYAFANHVRGLTDQTATLTLTDDPPTSAPSFSDDTGDIPKLDCWHGHHSHNRP